MLSGARRGSDCPLSVPRTAGPAALAAALVETGGATGANRQKARGRRDIALTVAALSRWERARRSQLQDARKGRAASVRWRAIGTRPAPASVKGSSDAPNCSYPCLAGAPAEPAARGRDRHSTPNLDLAQRRARRVRTTGQVRLGGAARADLSASYAGSGAFELKMSSAIFVEPSRWASCTTTYFPTSLTAAPPSGSIPSV